MINTLLPGELPTLIVVLVQRAQFEWSGVWSLNGHRDLPETDHQIERFYALNQREALLRARTIAKESLTAIASGVMEVAS